MWKALLLLWSIPLVLGLMAVARIARRSPAITDDAFRFLFGEEKEVRLSLWMVIKFAVLAAIFFLGGLLQGAVLLNFDIYRVGSAALLTASAAVLFLLVWVRTAPPARLRGHRPRAGLINGFSRKLSSYRSRLKPSGLGTTSARRKQRRRAAPVTRSYDDFEL